MIVAISCQGKFADVAESEAMQISLHPDDPPWGLLGSAINRTPVLIIRIIENLMSYTPLAVIFCLLLWKL